MKRILVLCSGLLFLPYAAGWADDVNTARDLVQQGKILPLARVLDMLESAHPGQVTEVELEYEDGLQVYEIDVITRDGRLIEVDMNAATGEIVDIDEEDDD